MNERTKRREKYAFEKKTYKCGRGVRLRPHNYLFKFVRFRLTENALKLLRPHERFCIVFACPHYNAENDGRVNEIMSGQSKSLISIVLFMLEGHGGPVGEPD